MNPRNPSRKPDWLKVKLPTGQEWRGVRELLRNLKLTTVCEEARCPNLGECWSRRSATIMILGKVCTRSCRFCAVTTGRPGGTIDDDEPRRVAQAVQCLGLRYVVITSVDRDDLPDRGSGHYGRTIAAIKAANPGTAVEVLIPDFGANRRFLATVTNERPRVLAHNVETVRRLTPSVRDRRSDYALSLRTLSTVKEIAPDQITKSGIMVGLGEEWSEIVATLRDLHDAGVEIVTIGQYLQPTRRHQRVARYYTPEEFERLQTEGLALGLRRVVSGPLVRSSYRAAQVSEGITAGAAGGQVQPG